MLDSLAWQELQPERQGKGRRGNLGNLNLQKGDIKILVNLKKVIALVLNIFCTMISSNW